MAVAPPKKSGGHWWSSSDVLNPKYPLGCKSTRLHLLLVLTVFRKSWSSQFFVNSWFLKYWLFRTKALTAAHHQRSLWWFPGVLRRPRPTSRWRWSPKPRSLPWSSPIPHSSWEAGAAWPRGRWGPHPPQEGSTCVLSCRKVNLSSNLRVFF